MSMSVPGDWSVAACIRRLSVARALGEYDAIVAAEADLHAAESLAGAR